MKELIRSHLNEIEAGEGMKVLNACESGSRAWGFPSTDSDYDVRFLYLRPVEWYLSIDVKPDVIEKPIDAGLDINGWDLRKALQLLRKSNPPLLEWLGSPIVYLDRYAIAGRMREFTSVYYSPTACLFHYLHMARGNFRAYLHGDEVWVKKYFYVLRPVLAMKWIENGLGVVPTEFTVLVEKLVDEPVLRTAIDRLLEAKRAGAELDRGPRIEPISHFIECELGRWESHEVAHYQRPIVTDQLNGFFRSSLREV